MKPVETRYARSGNVRIAYQAIGQGFFDMIFVPGFISNLELHWEEPGYARLLRRFATFSRLIQFDKRGTGLSDRVDPEHLPDLETRMDDVRAVMDAAGSGRATLFGASEGAPMAMLFAATYPQRTRSLVLYGAYANFHKWVMGPEQLARFIEGALEKWGTGATLKNFAPGLVADPHFSQWWARYERMSVSPSAAAALARMNAAIDVSEVLHKIRVPTLLIYRRDDARVNPDASRYLADHIPQARLVEIPGRDHPVWTADVDRVADIVEEFLTGATPQPTSRRVLSALLAARIVSPERLAARLGNRAWSDRSAEFREMAERLARDAGGQAFGFDGERATLRLDATVKAARLAIGLRDGARRLDLELAQAVHAGEVEVSAAGASGLAVHVAQRLASEAKPGEIVLSALAADLAAGSGLHFAERVPVRVEGVDQPLRSVLLVTEQHLEPAARQPKATSLDSLSEREREVLKLIADGLSNPGIAAELDLSEHTVKRHVANILLKLDLPSRSAAAALAARSPGA
jgi:pimeloyl-ACP methyl ester carboxylesterase/DNA-binding CsgD family transcriptional regulator